MSEEERRDQVRLVRACLTLYAETAPHSSWRIVQTGPCVYEMERAD